MMLLFLSTGADPVDFGLSESINGLPYEYAGKPWKEGDSHY